MALRFLVILFLSLWGFGTQAQVPYFEGLSSQISMGSQSHSPEYFDYKTSGTSNGLSTQTASSRGTPLAFSVTYTRPVSDYVLLGFSLEKNLLKTSAARQDLYNNGTYSTGGTIRFRNQTQLSLMPGVLIDASTMIYTKIGLAYASSDSNNDNGSAAQNFDFSGWGLGIGIKGFVFPHQFAFAEYNRVHMSDTLRTSASDPSATFQTSSKGSVFLVGVGWQF